MDAVVWHRCQDCRREWPFPKGPLPPASGERDWQCATCERAEHAQRLRAYATATRAAEEQTKAAEAKLDGFMRALHEHTVHELLRTRWRNTAGC